MNDFGLGCMVSLANASSRLNSTRFSGYRCAELSAWHWEVALLPRDAILSTSMWKTNWATGCWLNSFSFIVEVELTEMTCIMGSIEIHSHSIALQFFFPFLGYLRCTNHNCTTLQVKSFHFLIGHYVEANAKHHTSEDPPTWRAGDWETSDSFSSKAQWACCVNLYGPLIITWQYLITHKGIRHSCRSFT